MDDNFALGWRDGFKLSSEKNHGLVVDSDNQTHYIVPERMRQEGAGRSLAGTVTETNVDDSFACSRHNLRYGEDNHHR